MANVFEKAEKLAATALALLQRELKMAGLFVYRYGASDYAGAEGDTINIKRPPLLRARDAGFRTRNALVVDNLVQSRIQATLTKHPYSRVELTPEEATLDEVDYVRDVQAPQVRAISEDFDESIRDALAGATFVYEVDYVPSTTEAYPNDPRFVALRARKHLNDANVPATGRFWLVGSSVSESIAGNKYLMAVDTSGLPEALREGVVGKLGGFVIIEIPSFGADESYFVHNTAVAISAVAPVVPRGAAAGASVSGNGLAVTQVWDYQSDTMADQSTVHAFTGATPVLDPEVGSDGRIVLDDAGAVLMDFVRAVKVNYPTAVTASEGKVWTLASSGTVSGGSYLILVDGVATDAIAWDATNATITTQLNEIDGVAGVTVSGTTSKTVTFKKPVLLTVDNTAVTGGGTKTVTKVS